MAFALSWLKQSARVIKIMALSASCFLLFVLIVTWNSRPNPKEQFSSHFEIGQLQRYLPNTTENVIEIKPNRTVLKRILLWTKFIGYNDFYKGMGHAPFVGSCSVSDCEITTDRNLLRGSDAIVFHFVKATIKDIPRWRHPNQRWVFFLGESPAHRSAMKLNDFDGLFNWTMTYRLDSDIIDAYGYKTRISATTRRRRKTTSSTGEKRHLALWLVSHCKTMGHRERYIEELRRHMQVNVYGACAKDVTRRKCPEESCGAALYRSHKFYLAFENSVCRDYVTEKFYKALRNRIVPVVYGGADYERMAPPGSYVDVRDFESPRHLAEYLKAVDANDTLYEKYFAWTENWKVIRNREGGHAFCHLCAALHQRPLVDMSANNFKVYEDIATWWAGPGICGKIKTVRDRSAFS